MKMQSPLFVSMHPSTSFSLLLITLIPSTINLYHVAEVQCRNLRFDVTKYLHFSNFSQIAHISLTLEILVVFQRYFFFTHFVT